MAEKKIPCEVWKRELPHKQGNKTGKYCALKIELFPAHYWADRWQPGSTRFIPKLPLRTSDRTQYYESRFRIRVNGAWVTDRGAKYRMFKRATIARMYGFN